MIQPASLEELASFVEKEGKKVFLFGRLVAIVVISIHPCRN